MLVNIKSKKTNSFDYFFQRFENGRCIAPYLPRITTEESAKQFQPRNEGLKVLLINPSIREWSYPNIHPLGLAYISSVIVMDGHKLDILDLNAERKIPITEKNQKQFIKNSEINLVEKILKSKPDVIGIGGIISQYKDIKRLIKICKNTDSTIPVILGGGIATAIPELTSKKIGADILCIEEAEVSISELLFRLEKNISLDGCKGIWFKKDKEIINNGKRASVESQKEGLDFLPWPLYSKWHPDIYKINPVGHLNFVNKWKGGAPDKDTPFSMSMIASRGCSFHCRYCYFSYLGKKYRTRSPKEIVDEMQYLGEKYKVKYIHMLDDLFLVNVHWGREIFDEMEKRKKEEEFNIQIGFTGRANIIYDDMIKSRKKGISNILERGKEVGVVNVNFGIESLSDVILKDIGKSGQTKLKAVEALKETKRIFGYTDPSIMFGAPKETKETIKETVQTVKENNLEIQVIFYLTCYPSTTFWSIAIEKGIIGKAVTGKKCFATDDIIEQYLLRLGEQGDKISTNLSQIPDEELEDLANWAIQEMNAQNKEKNTVMHPHTGDFQIKKIERKVKNATFADL